MAKRWRQFRLFCAIPLEVLPCVLLYLTHHAKIETHQQLVVVHAVSLPSARHAGLLFTDSGLRWTSYGVLQFGA